MVPWSIGLLVYGTVAHLCLGRCEWQIRRFVKSTRNQTVAPCDWRRILLYIPAFAVLALIYPIAVLTAALTKTHVWRGVTYRVLNSGVQMLEPALHTTETEVAVEHS